MRSRKTKRAVPEAVEFAERARALGPRMEGQARLRDAHQDEARKLRAWSTSSRRRCSPASDPTRPPRSDSLPGCWYELQDQILHEEILERGVRLDGRRFDQIRPITCEVGVLPRTHGSALFTRGETQALVTVTLGTSADAQKLDWIEGVSLRRFMLHYNFPPFSVGEVKFLRGPGRREIGHGALAERSLLPLVPTEEQWPYTIRIVSDILESNGSSSMASICGGSLALLDAGVPQKAPVAGIAMGLVMIGEKWAVLTDIARRRGPSRRHGLQGRRLRAAGSRASRWTSRSPGSRPRSCDNALSRRGRRGSRSSRR